jgi:CheY-like chemotaxis protein
MKAITIVLVEDNEGDVLLTTELLEEAKFVNKLIIVNDGYELMNYIDKCFNESEKHVPDLILLDINLPRMNGIDVLNYIRNHNEINEIPVFMLSTSNVSIDVNKAFERKATAFLTKPLSLEMFYQTIIEKTNFYFQLLKK